MKTLTLTAIITGLLVLPFLVKRCRAEKEVVGDPDKRYDIDDYIEA
jgi:hypothetical protein